MIFFKKNIAVIIVVLYSVSILSFALFTNSASSKNYVESRKKYLDTALSLATEPTAIYRPYTSKDLSVDIPSIPNVSFTLAKPVEFTENEFFTKGYSADSADVVETNLTTALESNGWVLSKDSNLIIVEKIPNIDDVFGVLKIRPLTTDINYKTTIDGVLIKLN